jgi:SAM-dependent methyltransferase
MSQADGNIVQWVYAAKNNRELAERYDEWAKTYDGDLDQDFGWVGPAIAVEVAIKYIAANARMLDAGAGTGLVGKLLSDRGYTNLVAMDLSDGMLEIARQKNAYREYHRMLMGEPLGFPSNSFDAVISVGVFTLGHAPAHSLYELVRITKPGGHIVFGLRPDVYEEAGFKEKQTELVNQGKWKLLEVTDPVAVLPKGEPDVLHQVWVYQVA